VVHVSFNVIGVLIRLPLIGLLARRAMLSESESQEHQALMTALVNIENIAEVIETDMLPLAGVYIGKDYRASAETVEMVRELWQDVLRAVGLAVAAVGQKDSRAAEEVLLMKSAVRWLADRLFERHAQRLHADDPDSLERVRLLLSFIGQPRHVYTLAKRVAKTQVPEEVASRAA